MSATTGKESMYRMRKIVVVVEQNRDISERQMYRLIPKR